MNVIASTAAYERWLRKFFAPIEVDLARKHELMRHDRFTFFRATFYRWAQNWDRVAAPVRAAPPVLAIGDAHVENFGTWRDGEGRLVWGTNDFDEAAPIPYTNDLVRLAGECWCSRTRKDSCSLRQPKSAMPSCWLHRRARSRRATHRIGRGDARWLRDLVDSNLRDADHYWQKLLASPKWRGTLSHRTQSLLAAGPKNAQLLRVIHRTSGAGSLGRPRLTAIYLLDGATPRGK